MDRSAWVVGRGANRRICPLCTSVLCVIIACGENRTHVRPATTTTTFTNTTISPSAPQWDKDRQAKSSGGNNTVPPGDAATQRCMLVYSEQIFES
jgi:hypothetical protein